MKTYTAVVVKCSDTGLYVGHVLGFPGCHSQGMTLNELKQNLQEVLEMLFGPIAISAKPSCRYAGLILS